MSKFYDIKMSTTVPQTLDLYIYSDVEADYYDWWEGKIVESKTSSEHFRKELEAAGEVTQINIYINSLGGSVMEGIGIYNQLRRHKAHKTVYIDGFACSVASVIAMAGDEVIMPSNTMMMIHAPLTRVFGNASELRKAADELDKVSLSTMQAYLQKAGGKLTAERIAEMYAEANYWSATECIEMGLADRMADADVDIEAAIAKLEASGSASEAQQKLITRTRNAAATAAAKLANPPEQVVPKQEEKPPENPIEVQPKPEPVPKAEQKKADFFEMAENKIKKFFM